ncbi:MAG: hypothetical protein RIB84_26545 [Sneathiellaceae bacterium]
MFNYITHDKVEEVVRLAERAESAPHGDARDPQAPGRHNPPLRPQPAPDWEAALPDYLQALPGPALRELVALYCTASGAADSPREAVLAAADGEDAHRGRIDFLLSRSDLASVLRSAFMQR